MKIKTIAIITVSLVVGAAVGFLWAAIAFKKFEISKEVEAAAQTAFNANTLAMLRLGDVTNAIADLEFRADAAVVGLAVWDQAAPPDTKTREQRDKWLTSIKVYHQSYPFKSDDTNEVALMTEFLAKIPGRSATSTCKSLLCRMDDIRLSELKSLTNGVAK